MPMISRVLCGLPILAAMAWAQPFRLVATQGGVTSSVQNGSVLVFNAPVGQSVTAQVTAIYTGTGQVSIERQPDLLGSPAFAAALNGRPPFSLGPGGSFRFDVTFRPVSGALSSAQLSLAFVDSVQATGPGGAQVATGTLTLALQGTAPSFGLSYVLQPDQNVTALRPGDVLSFGPTPVNSMAQAGLNVNNLGSGPGAVTGISLLAGSGAFRLSRVPLFPVPVPAGQTLQVLVLYQPRAAAPDIGRVQITFDSGDPVVVNLEGAGSSPNFIYQLIHTSPPETVLAGGTVTFPAVAIGKTSSVLMQVANSGNAAGTVSAINVAGSGYQLTSPPVLPQTLTPGASLTFGVDFTPGRAGTLTGVLAVNSERFELRGTGLGAQLTFSYDVAGETVTIDSSNNSVVFAPVMISRSAQAVLNVRNTGTLAATVVNIGIGQNDSPFSVSDLPVTPLSLAPGGEFRIPITFRPTVLGFVNGVLRIDSTSLSLVGSGTPPPPLSAYTITGPSGNVTPGPVNLSVALAEPYPVAIAGTLNLGIATPLPADPAAQFASGGTSVRFVIPAGSRNAVFSNQASQIGLQTGTVTGTFAVTPSFATQAGGVDLTPSSPATLQFRIAPAAPVLLALQVSGQSTAGFTLTVTGFSTTRVLNSMAIDLTPASGVRLASNRFTVDLQQIGSVWFRSSSSQAFGGLFTVTVPFTLQGATAQPISGASAVVSNDIGPSNALQSSSQ